MGCPYALSRFTTMWNQNYTPIAGSLGFSSIAAAIPIFVLLFLLGVKRKPAWIAALSGLAAAALVATFAYGMPADKLFSAVIYGVANGLFPIGWVVFTAILLYRITVEMGKFETLKDSVGNLSQDRRLQALLIAFAFGAFIEGAAGSGGVRVDRHAAGHAAGHHQAAAGQAQRGGRPHLRAGLADRPGLLDPGHGRMARAQRCGPSRPAVRPFLRRHAIFRFELCGTRADRYPGFAGGHRIADRVVQGVEAERQLRSAGRARHRGGG